MPPSPSLSTSETLRRTTITPHLEAEIEIGQNLVYCASFQVAWNRLLDAVIHEPLQLTSNPRAAEILNQRLSGEQDISEASYLAMAGFGRDEIVTKIEQALQAKFNKPPEVDLTLNSPDDILAYAYLEKNVPFDTEFEVFKKPLRFADNTPVQSFGVEEKGDAIGQVAVLDYQHEDDFILRLQGDNDRIEDESEMGRRIDYERITDQIILAKIPPKATLRETIETVLTRTQDTLEVEWMFELRDIQIKKCTRAGEDWPRFNPMLDVDVDEILQIPKIDLNLIHSFTELLHKPWLNQTVASYRFGRALQTICFSLDEKGASLASEAVAMGYLGIAETVRSFIFNKPFLLCLKERSARYPYLAIWIDNAELLVKS